MSPALSTTATATTPDLTSPDPVGTPVALATSATSARVTWTKTEDNVAVTGYLIWRDGAKVGQVGATTTKFDDASLSPSTTYTYGVSAFDAAGNTSQVTDADPVTTPAASSDTTPPTTPTGLQGTVLSGSKVALTWNASTDDTGVDHYDILRDGVPVGTSTTTSYQDTGLVAATTYTWKVQALDAAGNRSSTSSPVTLTTPDDVAPTKPSNLAVSGTSYRNLTVSWTASTDNVGVSGYVVSRDGATLGTTTKTSFTDTTAPAATNVTYTVVAQDAAGNQSGPASLSVTTPAPATLDSGWIVVDDSAYVQSGSSADNNYQYASFLKVAGGKTPRVTYLKVTVPADTLPLLDHLYLQLTTSNTSKGFDVYLADSNAWDRTTITWNTQPGWSGSAVASSGRIDQTGTVPAPPGVIDLASRDQRAGNLHVRPGHAALEGRDLHEHACFEPDLGDAPGRLDLA